MFDFLKKKQQKGETITLKIDGMHCVSCSMNIDGVLEEIDGVYEAKTQYAKARTQVLFDPKKVQEKDLFTAIQAAGYSAVKESKT